MTSRRNRPAIDDPNYLLNVSRGLYNNHVLVHKFGRNLSVANGAWELIANLSVAYAGFVSAATTVRVKAGGNAADTLAGAGARKIKVVGLNFDATAEIEEEIDLAGAGASAVTAQQFFRVYRAYVTEVGTYGSSNTGAIVVENGTGGTDLLRIEAGDGQTQLGSFSIPSGMTAYLLSFAVQVDSGKAADFRIFTREKITNTATDIQPKRIRHYVDGILGSYSEEHSFNISEIVGPADIWMEANGSGAITEVSADMNILCIGD